VGKVSSDESAILTKSGARLFKIERMLRAGPSTMRQIKAHVIASQATVKRDLESLRYVYGAPIVFDHEIRAYTISGEWPGLIQALEREVATL
jgi:hypothetical protein